MIVLLLSALFVLPLTAGQIVVGPGGDYTTIQAALNGAQAGDSILVRDDGGVYNEKLVFKSSGDSLQGYISLLAFPGHHPVLDGSGVSGGNMIKISFRSYIRVKGFEIRNNLNVSDGSGIRITGAGSHFELCDNIIHEIRGSDAMGITIYGTSTTPLSDLLIDGNQIYDCDAAYSEALTLNGNVRNFTVSNNIVHDVNNIGIDFIGGESWVISDPALVTRDGVCRGNTVYRARSVYGGGYAAGIYVDGGKNIIIENNTVYECDLGMEIGAENSGIVTSGIIVRNNLLYNNDKVGLIFGGYAANTGRVKNCSILNNTCYRNDTLNEGWGEIAVQYAEDNTIRDNIFYATEQNILLYSETGSINNQFDYNLWFIDGNASAAKFIWRSSTYFGLPAFRSGSGQEANGQFVNPSFVDAVNHDFHIDSDSPAWDAGDPNRITDPAERDMDGEPRLSGARVDIGADEIQVTSVQMESRSAKMPRSFKLSAFPNPFNSLVRLQFEIAEPVQNSQLTIYDVRGMPVRVFKFSASHSGINQVDWNGKDIDGRPVASGIYFAVFSAAGHRRAIIKINFLK